MEYHYHHFIDGKLSHERVGRPAQADIESLWDSWELNQPPNRGLCAIGESASPAIYMRVQTGEKRAESFLPCFADP